MSGNIVFIAVAALNICWCISGVYSSSCRESNNGLTVHCEHTYLGMKVTAFMKFRLCGEKPTAYLQIDADNLGIHIKQYNVSDLSMPVNGMGTVNLSLKRKGDGTVTISSSINMLLVGTITIYSKTVNPNCSSISSPHPSKDPRTTPISIDPSSCRQNKTNDEITIHCEITIRGKNVSIVMKLKPCREKPIDFFKINADALGIHLEKWNVSNLSIPLNGIGSLKLSLTSKGDGDKVAISSYIDVLGMGKITIYSKTVTHSNCTSIPSAYPSKAPVNISSAYPSKVPVNIDPSACRQSKTKDGVTIHCEVTVLGKSVSFVMKLKLCRDRPITFLKINADALGIYLEKRNIASASIPLAVLGSLKLSLKPSNDYEEVHLSVSMAVILFGNISIYSNTFPVPGCNAFVYWFYSTGTGTLVGIGFAAFLFVILCIVCCYCCFCRRKKSATEPYEEKRNAVI